LKTMDLEVLRKICDDIMLSTASTLKFRFSSNMSELVSMEASEDNSDELDEKIPQKSNSTTNADLFIISSNNMLIFHLGKNIIDLNVLSGVCDEIESERVNKPVLKKHFYLLTLSFEPNISRHVRRARTGRFIGKGGENVRAMQDKHNVCLKLIDRSSNEKRCQRLDELKKTDEKRR
ncbi:unnamed protein product, partial [Rotaria magnacalcarata]